MENDETMRESRMNKMHDIESAAVGGSEKKETVEKVFGNPVVEALKQEVGKKDTPLLSQEDIYDGKPFINWTAVICTAIVVAAATVIICVAQPWKKSDTARNIEAEHMAAEQVEETDDVDVAANEVGATAADGQDAAPATEETETTVVVQQPVVAVHAPVGSTLPVVSVTTTGTSNIYNNIRLIDASSRLLTKDEVAQMTKNELALARNAIYARHGYSFKNADLGSFFSVQSWFKPTDVDINAIPFTEIELANIKLIKAAEKKAE